MRRIISFMAALVFLCGMTAYGTVGQEQGPEEQVSEGLQAGSLTLQIRP